ncbi:S41 family peptidase [Abyssisolibacter fermentans]|uniref:S41 family peptidase n=1 Tax=Abyssisolibacter fermentans TaxID=1766203 RepID=UPI00082984EA|nr:S41 family peptidase [Abyssisolibacter fermentans]
MKIKVSKKHCLVFTIGFILALLIYFINDYRNYTKELDVYKNFIMDNHPKCTEEFINAKKDVFNDIYKENYSKKDIFKAVSMMVATLNDAHSKVYDKEIKYKVPDFRVTCYDNRFYILEESKTYPLLEKGDEIIQIGDMKIDEIIKEMSKYLTADNIYYLNSRLPSFLFTDVYFKYLNLNPNNTEIQVKKKNNEIKTLNISLNVDFNKKYKPLNNNYDINENYAVLKMKYMVDSMKNIEMLSNFFEEVNTNKINNIIIDISKCSGGYLRFIDEFFKYLPIESYYSLDNVLVNNNQKYDENLYKGNIIVLTSNYTYSGGCIFAGLIKYNDVGILIGETVGNNSTLYNNPKTSINSNYVLKVATVPGIIPNKNNESLITPHIMLSDVINDYKGINMYNDDMDKLYDIILETCNNYTPNN